MENIFEADIFILAEKICRDKLFIRITIYVPTKNLS